MRYAAAIDASGASGATADDVGAHLWNPDANKWLYLREVHVFTTVATAQHPGLVRTTTIGTTPGTTVNPDADNAFDRAVAPSSSADLYAGTFATDPAVAGPYLTRAIIPGAIGAAVMWSFLDEPIGIPPGTGIGVATPIATALQLNRYTFIWDE
jgi:hypothetical protein